MLLVRETTINVFNEQDNYVLLSMFFEQQTHSIVY
jgi:hypothetical protein